MIVSRRTKQDSAKDTYVVEEEMMQTVKQLVSYTSTKRDSDYLRMAGSAVDDRAVCNIFSIMDEDSPDVDEHEKCNVSKLLKREHEGKEVVRHRLCIAIKRVEGVRCEWSRHDPLVVRLVESLVDRTVMQTAVNPVDQEIGKGDEEWELEQSVPASQRPSGTLWKCVVDQ